MEGKSEEVSIMSASVSPHPSEVEEQQPSLSLQIATSPENQRFNAIVSVKNHPKLGIFPFRNRNIYQELAETHRYVEELEALLRQHQIDLPDPPVSRTSAVRSPLASVTKYGLGIMRDGNAEELRQLMKKVNQFHRHFPTAITFKDVSYWTMAPKAKIATVGTSMWSMIFGSGPKHRVDILKGLTGRFLPNKMVLVMGPPGSGKSVFMQAITGRLRQVGNARLEGDIRFNGENIKTTEKFLIGKVADYVEQNDTHAATLTVEETLKYAWMSATGGHHSYAIAKDEKASVILDDLDALYSKVNNMMIIMGLTGCKNTYVGDGSLKGISGGQKRRVTSAEMLATPRHVKFFDAMSNGLDAATTYDIAKAFQISNRAFGGTLVVSLLQPPPEVFDLFDEILLLSEGQIIYQGPRNEVVEYFRDIGYVCPEGIDVADFLQEIPTTEGARYVKKSACKLPDGRVPRTTESLVAAWKGSRLFQQLLQEIEAIDNGQLIDIMKTNMDPELAEFNRADLGEVNPYAFPADLTEPYPGTFWYHFKITLQRQILLTRRDKAFIMSRIGQRFIVGGIAGSLFSNIAPNDVATMNGFLFFSVLFSALAAFPMMPLVFAQKAIYYKHVEAKFYPTSAFIAAQVIVLIPLFLIEAVIFGSIMYWSAGLSIEVNGSRFLAFILINFIFAVTTSQLFRLFACVFPDATVANPCAGIVVVLMVLFSGFIQPKSEISYGWMWFYWINPVSWALSAVTVNQYKSSAYNEMKCVSIVNATCVETKRFGDSILEQYGNPISQKWIWYSLAVLIGLNGLYFFASYLALKYLRLDSAKPLPIKSTVTDEDDEVDDINSKSVAREGVAVDGDIELATPSKTTTNNNNSSSKGRYQQSPTTDNQINNNNITNEDNNNYEDNAVPFTPVTVTFKDIWYTVTLKGGEELDLLKSVSGYFKPGTITALMGSSGAGKTTLLDVISGRKNAGKIEGNIYVNDELKEEHSFRSIMGYVEQFESLSPHDTAKEAIAFSAALRLPVDTTDERREQWIRTVIAMLELEPIEDMMIGWTDKGGMSFEQKKRVSIGVELAANPAILFLDEPTTGLDSRAAQIVMRSIRRVAESNRTVVCTIHQPSIPIFSQFDSLLLLRRGGQTVFFGPLGTNRNALVENNESSNSSADAAVVDLSLESPMSSSARICENLIAHFEAAPDAPRIKPGQNPSTWMLEVIGAGTASVASITDYHEFYKASALCEANAREIEDLIHGVDEDEADEDHVVEMDRCGPLGHLRRNNKKGTNKKQKQSEGSHAINNKQPYHKQFKLLCKKIFICYWRTPSYNLVRIIINIIIALVFGSAYAQQEYSTAVGCVSRSAVIYITLLFCGVVGMQTVLPVTFAERPAFYREQQSEMYSVALYTLVTTLVEIPYLIVSSLSFVLPFFYIVGFDNTGDVTAKFLWYWLFQGLYMSLLVYMGQFFAALMPTTQSADVMMGMTSTLISLFCGFMIKQENFATFWLFIYWLDPLHYALEGLTMSQFRGDSTVISIVGVGTTTAERFINSFYSKWSYDHIGNDIVALVMFIVALRVGTFLALTFLRHETR